MFKNTIPDKDESPKVRRTSFLSRFGLKQLLIILLVISAIGGVATGVTYFRKYQALKADPTIEAQKETQALVATVSKLMELPADESPTVATIADKDKLKDQMFFSKAENGDKILAFNKSMFAILYRPSVNKIINVAPIIDQTAGVQPTKPTTQISAGLKISYYNGTETIGLSGQAEEAVKTAYSNYQTAIVSNASKKDYKETLVIDLSGTHSKEAGEIASLLKGRVSSLPNGETKPDADILIISGK